MRGSQQPALIDYAVLPANNYSPRKEIIFNLRIFNRDVILIDGNETVEMFHGGINNRPGKGVALILGVIREGQTGVF